MNLLEILKKLGLYTAIVTVFALVSLAYFHPVLSGKQLDQVDIEQFKGMAKQVKDFTEQNNRQTYWMDNVFCGMPTYQVTGNYPNDFIQHIDRLIRFLPRPADYLFLYFIGFFVLLSVLKINWKLALIGSLAFGFSTYLLIILGEGHNSKAHAIGYIPLVIAGVWLIFHQKYFWGFLLTSIFATLEIYANHLQMSYYLGFAILLFCMVWGYFQIKDKHYSSLVKCFCFLILSGLIAIGTNANRLLPTKEYSHHSTRGKSSLNITPEGRKKASTKSGLSKNYITQYSYGVLESFNLAIPRFMGGGSRDRLDTDSNTYHFLAPRIGARQARNFINKTPPYWGDQPFVAAPAYLGIILVFCFVLGLFLQKSTLHYWGLIAIVFALLLSWGKNFPILTNFFIDHIPLYDKFRAVSSIQILIEVLVPLLAIYSVHTFFSNHQLEDSKRLKVLKNNTIIFVCGLVLLYLFGGTIFSFSGVNDAYLNQMIDGFASALRSDRKAMLKEDVLFALFLVLGTSGLFWLRIKSNISNNVFVVLLGTLLLVDLVSVSKKYIHMEQFKNPNDLRLSPTAIDREILKDTSHYRVFNTAGSFMNDGLTSYYHKSIGGYHAAKLGRYQDLVDFHLSGQPKPEILNMLNVKYLITSDEQGKPSLKTNPNTNGNAWFIEQIQAVNNDDEAITSLGNINTKTTAITGKKDWERLQKQGIQQDTLNEQTAITLKKHQMDRLTYEAQTDKARLAVFSEIFYKDGWEATIDGTPVPIIRANYLLRALAIPKGRHTIVFEFKPNIIALGGQISLASYGLFVVVLVGVGLVCLVKRPKSKAVQNEKKA